MQCDAGGCVLHAGDESNVHLVDTAVLQDLCQLVMTQFSILKITENYSFKVQPSSAYF